MIFPFGNIIVEENADPTNVYLWNPRYKTVLVEGGMKEIIDWDETGKASAVIFNLKSGNI